MIFIPKSIVVTGDAGFLKIDFDLVDDEGNVSIRDIVVASVINHGLPNFLFLHDIPGAMQLYTKRIIMADNGHQEIIRENVAKTLLSEQIIKQLCLEREKYLKERFAGNKKATG